MTWAKAQDLGLFTGVKPVMAAEVYPLWFLQPEYTPTPQRWPPKVSSVAHEREWRTITATGQGTDVELLRVQGSPSRNYSLEYRNNFRTKLFQKQDGKCHWCQETMDLENRTVVTINGRVKNNGRFASFEHLIPRHLGGRFNEKNIRLSHSNCNNGRERPCKKNLPRYAHDPMRVSP